MGDSAQYSTSTRDPIGLPSISTFTPLINNGFRDQHSPRFSGAHTTTTTTSSATATTGAATESKPFTASISYGPLGGSKQQQPLQLQMPQTPKRDGSSQHPPGSNVAFHVEQVKKKSPLKKSSPVPKAGPPPTKKLALTPLSPPKNGSNGSSSISGSSSSGMPALEAALRSPTDADVSRHHAPPPQAPPPSTTMPPPGTGNLGPPRTPVHQTVTVSRSLEFNLDGVSPFNPNDDLMSVSTPNGNNGFGYAPSPSNGHRGYGGYGESSRESPMSLAPLEPLTTTFPTHSPAPHNGSNAYYSDWSNPSLASPMTLPPLNTIFSGHSTMDQPQSSTQFSASPISAYSATSPSASLLAISVQQQQQTAAGHAAAVAGRPHSRPGADYGHYSGPLSHQSTSSIVWEENPPPPAVTPTTLTTAAAAAGGGQRSAAASPWAGGGMQQHPPGAPIPRRPSLRLPLKMTTDGKSPHPQDPAYEKVQLILAESKAAESAAAARRAAEASGRKEPIHRTIATPMRVGKVQREMERPEGMDDIERQEFERKEKKRLAQNEARRKKRQEKLEQERIMAESSQQQLLLPVRQVPMPHPHHLQQHPHALRPMQHPLHQLHQQQPPTRRLAEGEDPNCSITASINAVVHLESGYPADSLHRAAARSIRPAAQTAAAPAVAPPGHDQVAFSQLRAAMLAEEVPLVIRKESNSSAHAGATAAVAAIHSATVLQGEHPPSSSRLDCSSSVIPQQLQQTKLASGVRRARERLMREYQRSLGSSISPGTSSRFLEVVTETRAVEEAQAAAERDLERLQTRCAQLAEMTKLQHDTLQHHLKKIARGEDTSGLPTSVRQGQQLQLPQGHTLRSLALLDKEIRCRSDGLDPSEARRRVSVTALLTPPCAPAAALRLAPPTDDEVKDVKKEIKVETATASTMTEKEMKVKETTPTRRVMSDQSTRPLERCYLAGVKELLAEGYNVREGGTIARPPRETGLRSGASAPVQLVDVEGRVWSEAHSTTGQRQSNGVQQHSPYQLRRPHDEGETTTGQENKRVLRSSHRHTGYH